MNPFIKVHLVIIVVALIIAFALFPMEMFFFEDASREQIHNYYNDAITMKNSNAWKIFFTWFLGLSCGRLIIKALRDPSANIDPKHKNKH